MNYQKLKTLFRGKKSVSEKTFQITVPIAQELERMREKETRKKPLPGTLEASLREIRESPIKRTLSGSYLDSYFLDKVQGQIRVQGQMNEYGLTLADVKPYIEEIIDNLVEQGAEESALDVAETFDYSYETRQKLAEKAYSNVRDCESNILARWEDEFDKSQRLAYISAKYKIHNADVNADLKRMLSNAKLLEEIGRVKEGFANRVMSRFKEETGYSTEGA